MLNKQVTSGHAETDHSGRMARSSLILAEKELSAFLSAVPELLGEAE
jgi:hypothetical protein